MKKLTFLVAILMLAAPIAGFAGDGLTFKSDLRLRYESKDADGKMNRGRARFRLRIAAETKLDDNWTLGFRLASGSDPDPTSTNQSMDDNFAKKDMWIDRVYAIYKAGNVKIAAGKIANPFETTDIIWDSDINLEGVAETFSFENGHITLGQMVLSENSSAADAYLLAAQGGFTFSRVSVNLGYYSYSNYVENSPYAGGNLFENGTAYTLMDLLVNVEITDQFSVWAHYVTNSDAEDTLTTGDKEDTATGLGFTYKMDDWKLSVKYADIEPNAVVGAFSDSDFGQANRKGYKVSLSKKLRKNVSMGMAYFDTEASTDGSHAFKMVQLDLKFKF